MAIQLALNVTRIGASFPQAYVRVAKIDADKTTTELTLYVYASAEARTANASSVDRRKVTLPTPTGAMSGLLAAMYEHIKTLPDYSGATDV